jgi:hypothetical protein
VGFFWILEVLHGGVNRNIRYRYRDTGYRYLLLYRIALFDKKLFPVFGIEKPAFRSWYLGSESGFSKKLDPDSLKLNPQQQFLVWYVPGRYGTAIPCLPYWRWIIAENSVLSNVPARPTHRWPRMGGDEVNVHRYRTFYSHIMCKVADPDPHYFGNRNPHQSQS